MSERLAFLFPGQGGSLTALPTGSPRLDALIAQTRARGLRLADWMENGDENRLRQTDAAQPALLLDSLDREETLRAAGFQPSIVAGHSLGEYSALVSAGVLRAEDALDAVIERGRLMNTVVGTMAAIVKLDLETVSSLCKEAGSDVVIANHNGPTQIVVSGSFEAVDSVCELATGAGGKAIPLTVSGPFHSPFMLPAQEALAVRLDTLVFSPPSIPVVSGVTGETHSSAAGLKMLLRRQITAPVRWIDVLCKLVEFGVTTAIEVGSGDILTKIGKRSGRKIRFITSEEAIHEGS